MALQNAYAQYRKIDVSSAVEGATPHRLIQMLMDGALQNMARAKGAISNNAVAAKGEAIGKAVSIVTELRNCLNLEQGGEIAENLEALYRYITDCLLTANLESNEAKVDEAATLLKNIKAGWDGIESQV